MASSYALPASAMTHTHSHHGHVHSQSLSPSRHPANTPKSLRQERSIGSFHSYSASESHLGHIHEHPSSPHYEREASPYFEPVRAHTPGHDDPFGMTDDLPAPAHSYQPPSNTVSHEHSHRRNSHTRVVSAVPRSRFTNFILPYTLPWPLLHTILANKDSRRIFYFMSLNFAFMLVQACYGFLTDSLGLLSDSIHMFFDCLALAVGLFASIASKWPPSERFPYGFGMIESLSGFGNGVFLMLISIEITTEAVERLAEGRETKRLAELFVVSSMGLAVNLVGMAAFGHHGHAGHDHGSHSHGHSHDGHSHGHGESHSHDGHHHEHKHDHHDHDHHHASPLLSEQSPKKASHSGHSHGGHAHSHDNENMHGIFLHVLADTMGSAAVIVSTTLIRLTGWNGWDPVASCIIATLIFMSSIPLIKSCASKLLLTVPDAIEYNLRDALGGVGELRGVASYSVPRFWRGDKSAENESAQVLGVIHLVATRGSDLDEVKERTRAHFLGCEMDVVVQIEKDGDTSCWCGGNTRASPSRFT